MLCKAFRPLNKSLMTAQVSACHPIDFVVQRAFGSNPGILHRIFNTVDTGTHAYRVATYDPLQPYTEKVSLADCVVDTITY